jgi:hypothetical protein
MILVIQQLDSCADGKVVFEFGVQLNHGCQRLSRLLSSIVTSPPLAPAQLDHRLDCGESSVSEPRAARIDRPNQLESFARSVLGFHENHSPSMVLVSRVVVGTNLKGLFERERASASVAAAPFSCLELKESGHVGTIVRRKNG